MDLETQLEETERTLGHMWKAMIVRGIVAIAFAVLIIVWPNIGLATLIALFGAFALVSGIATVVGAFSVELPTKQRVGLVLQGLLGITVGVVVFVWPDLSALGLLYAIAIWAIALGIFEIVLAFDLPISGKRSLLLGLGGLLSIAFGVIMFAKPGAGAIAVLALIAAFALVSGIMEIAYAIELKRLTGELDERVKPFIRPKPVTHG